MLTPHPRLDLDRRRAHDRFQTAEEGLEVSVLELEASGLVNKLLMQLGGRSRSLARELHKLRPQHIRQYIGYLAALQHRHQQLT